MQQKGLVEHNSIEDERGKTILGCLYFFNQTQSSKAVLSWRGRAEGAENSDSRPMGESYGYGSCSIHSMRGTEGLCGECGPPPANGADAARTPSMHSLHGSDVHVTNTAVAIEHNDHKSSLMPMGNILWARVSETVLTHCITDSVSEPEGEQTLTFAFWKNLCFSSSDDVGLKNRRMRAMWITSHSRVNFWCSHW